jgi:hypothetical protein
MENHHSNRANKLLGIRRCISLLNNPWWFILSNAFDMSMAHILTVDPEAI